MGEPNVVIVIGPGVAADPGLLRQVAETEWRALGVPGRLVVVGGPTALWDVLTAAGQDETCAVVVLHGPDVAVRPVLSRPGPHAARTVWYDTGLPGPAEVATGSVRMAGRGIWGLAWAVRHAVHRLRHPARRVPYGPAADQWAELRLPDVRGGAPVPVAVLVHGGFWRSIWGADLMDALAIDLAARGYAAWNLEYRRPDQHGWQSTTADVADGFGALTALATGSAPPPAAGPAIEDGPPLDPERIAVVGHSAGGQLAFRLAADAGGVALAVSLAGVLDLAEADRRRLGTGAVAGALGGTREEVPWVYAAADPLTRLPLGVPQLVVQGTGDDLDMIDMSRRYAAAAQAAGDDVVHLERPGDHFDVIDPASPAWQATAAELARRLRP
ncbi:alpha/beta hydrolase family protein [Sphaerisporangium aureirubrum]|uniref:Alpha/beta hydrolase family protein n=1 Tax=Sphaerisporangium aureirubrum TaxID=1544736 RepID=A0ABW1NH93_9ACTN